MSDYGIKVSKPGYPAETTDPTQLIFNSEWSTLKIAQVGSSTHFCTTNATTTWSVAHGLGYIPFFFSWWSIKDPSKLWLQFSDDDGRQALGFYDAGIITTDAVNINFSFSITGEPSSFSVTCYYVLFTDVAYA